MLIGLGGGAASSMTSGQSRSDLDFASVQRGNAEMQRRCQEVIDACCALGDANPVQLIHDVGAGGLSNALPELAKDAGTGADFELRQVPNADPGMAPMEIWCNEAQERYVMAVAADKLATFAAICARERCPYAVVGEATPEAHLRVSDSQLGEAPVDLPMDVLFGNAPQLHRSYKSVPRPSSVFELAEADLAAVLARVLRFPAVGSKKFLITIGDRSITGLVAQEQMVGPWQEPVADVAVTASGFNAYTGEAMCMGERPALALLNPAASARMAVGEALTNLLAARVTELSRVVLSANWMAAAGRGQEDQALFEAVRAVGMELCPALGIAVPVGKDSLSMRTAWQADEPVNTDATAGAQEQSVTSPMTVNITAFAPVTDIRQTLTPQLRLDIPDTKLLLLSNDRQRLGGSALAQVSNQLGTETPDVDDPEWLIGLFNGVLANNDANRLLAYHDRSDGGMLVAALEMGFAGRCGIAIELAASATDRGDVFAELFNEELGALVQVRSADADLVCADFAARGVAARVIGAPVVTGAVRIRAGAETLLESDRVTLQQQWASTSYHLQRLRDNPACADMEFASIAKADPGLSARLSFAVDEDITAPFVNLARPPIAVLREQGVNGQIEMAAAFDRAGFTAVDVHMSDLLAQPELLDNYSALVACGGFSYGDVLGGGGGWAKSILFDTSVREAFERFFARDTLALGVCNGCQMFAQLKSLVPGADSWPRFVTNASQQFEGRTVLVKVESSDSPWLTAMSGSVLPVAVAHGEGFAELGAAGVPETVLRYVDNQHQVTQDYPANPNGSPNGIAGLTAAEGRVLIMMPHPERVFRASQNAWCDPSWQEAAPWLRLFRNARVALG